MALLRRLKLVGSGVLRAHVGSALLGCGLGVGKLFGDHWAWLLQQELLGLVL